MIKTEKLLERWLMGSDAPAKLTDFPEAWHPLLYPESKPQDTQQPRSTQQNGQPHSLTALAVFGHYQALTQRPTTETALNPFPLLPKLSYPLINEHNASAYHITIRLLEQSSHDDGRVIMLLTLLADRGYALPPNLYFEHMATLSTHSQSHQATFIDNDNDNKKEADSPSTITDLYQPWQQYWNTWKTRLTHADINDDLEINADNWADFMPAFRRQALQHLRKKDPTACRILIADCFLQEPADERVKILKVLYDNLSSEDVPFLQSQLNNRSKKVSEIVNQLLIRSGQFEVKNGNDDNQITGLSEEEQVDIDLLISGFEVIENTIANRKKYKLKDISEHSDPSHPNKPNPTPAPTKIIRAKVYREHKKRNKRRELLTKYGLYHLANALNIELEELILGWAFNTHHVDDNDAFLDSVGHLPDAFMPIVAEALSGYDFEYVHTILQIWHRFTKAQQQQLLKRFMQNNALELRFHEMLSFGTVLPAENQDNSFDFESLQLTSMWKILLGIGIDKKKHSQNSYLTEEDCLALGLLLPQSLAKETLEFLQDKLKNDYSPNDPMYYALRLNAGLDVI